MEMSSATNITANGEDDVNAIYADENVWLTQKMMGVLYDVGVNTINYHLKKLFSDGEIQEDSVIRIFRITASDGKSYNAKHYNLARINMFLHDINFDKFDIAREDTLKEAVHEDDAPFDAIVSNPPYSIRWEGKNNPLNINDERFKPAGVLAPPSKADLAFTMHMLYYLSTDGTAAIVEFPGVLYRGGAEAKIREYMVKSNFVDAVIQLPADLFFGTTIATCILVLKKSKVSSDILFVAREQELRDAIDAIVADLEDGA